jgi:hypothetical protein
MIARNLVVGLPLLLHTMYLPGDLEYEYEQTMFLVLKSNLDKGLQILQSRLRR